MQCKVHVQALPSLQVILSQKMLLASKHVVAVKLPEQTVGNMTKE